MTPHDKQEPESSEALIEELRDENRKLREQLAKHDEQSERASNWLRRFRSFLVRVLLGRRLRSVLPPIIAWARTGSYPGDGAVSDFVASVFARFVRVGLLVVLLAVLPTAIHVWSLFEMRAQTREMRAATLIVKDSSDNKLWSLRSALLTRFIKRCEELSRERERLSRGGFPPGFDQLVRRIYRVAEALSQIARNADDAAFRTPFLQDARSIHTDLANLVTLT